MLGRDSACDWASVQLDYDKEEERWYAFLCGRMVYRQGAILLIGRRAQRVFPSALSTWKKKCRSECKKSVEEMRKTTERHGERQNEEATRNGRSNAHHG